VRILLTGATGLIGSAVLARLVADGDEVVAIARPGSAARARGAVRWVSLDIARAVTVGDWLPHLAGVDAVVNCAGVLQDGPGDSTAGVHVEAAGALFAACGKAGVRRLVHVSALGADSDAATAFTRSKWAGDTALMASPLDWIILRPSVVVGRPVYGGSALLRGLAALPVIPKIAEAGLLQVVQLEDLVGTIRLLLAPGAPARVVLDIVGPERLTLVEVIGSYRRWLGGRDAPPLNVPAWVSRLVFRAGDLAGMLGWRPPLRSTVRLEIARGSVGDPAPWTRLTGIEPRALGAALASEPATIQEKWFARLYFIKPIIIGVLSLFWLGTGLIAIGPGWEAGVGLLRQAGVSGGAAAVMALAGALADIAIGIGIAVRASARAALCAALALSAVYLLLGTLLMPHLWLDPTGPLLKIVPLLPLNLAALAILDDR
jgi:uncharacterized protein YbjT (DUF2867 family)